MKLISWNVNGLRACLNKGFMDFFWAEQPDIFCIQETKMQPEQVDFQLEGYEMYWHSAKKKGITGVTSNSTEHSVKLAKMAQEMNFDAVVAAPPYLRCVR